MSKFLPAVLEAVKTHRFAILYGLKSPSSQIWIDAARSIYHG